MEAKASELHFLCSFFINRIILTINRFFYASSSVCHKLVSDAAAVEQSERRRIRPGGGRADAGGGLAASAARLRVLPALPRVARLPAQHRQEGHRPKVRPTGAASSLFWFYS